MMLADNRMGGVVATLRRQLLLSVSLLAGGFTAYGRGAYGQQVCMPTGGTNYLCQGWSYDTQTISIDNGHVEAGDGLIVETDPGYGGNGGDAIAISGGGEIRFTSAPDSYVVASGEASGLSIVSTGDIGTTPGSIFVDTSGYFGGRYGINAVNYGNGGAAVRFDGTAIGTIAGILARNAGGAGGLSVTIGENAYIEGGLAASNFGGSLAIEVDGFIVSGDGAAIGVVNGAISDDVSVATGADSELHGLAGIHVTHAGSGTGRIDVGGSVTGTGLYGVRLRSQANAGDLIITTAAGSYVTGAEAIVLRNLGRGNSSVTVSGDVATSHYFGYGLRVSNSFSAGDATVTAEQGSNVVGDNRGIEVINRGTGATTVSVDGSASATRGAGVYVRNTDAATGITVSVGETGRVHGAKYGIQLLNEAGGGTDISIDGDVTGASGIVVSSVEGSRLTIGKGATVTATGLSTVENAIKVTGQASVTIAGSMAAQGGHAIQFDTTNAFDDRLELQTEWEIDGIVDAGLGFDTLVFSDATNGSGETDSTADMASFLNFEAIAKTGTSILELTGSNADIADFAVNRGTLVLNAGLGGMDFVIASGATLTGSGTAGSLAVSSGAIIAPGTTGTIDTLTAVGSADFEAGSRFLVDFAADGRSDRIVADTARIDGGMVFATLVPSGGALFDGQRFVILETVDDIEGGFAGFAITLNSLFLDFAFANTATQVALEANIASFESVATTSNQASVARHLFALPQSADPDAHTVYNRILFAPTLEDARAVVNAASGEIHAGTPGVLATSSLGFGQFLTSRAGNPPSATPPVAPLAYAPAPPAVQAIGRVVDPVSPAAPSGLWAQLIGSRASIGGGGTAADLDLSLAGFAAGTELAMTEAGFSAALALGYTQSWASAPSSQAAIDSGHIGIFGAMEDGPLMLSAAAHLGLHTVETSRDAVLGGLGGTATARHGAQSLGVSAAARYSINLGGVALSPFLGADAAYIRSDGATETGAGILNLSIAPADHITGTLTTGIALGHEWWLGDSVRLRAELSAAYEQSLGGAPNRNLALATATQGHTLSGGHFDDSRVALGAGIELAFDSGLTFSGGYRGSFGTNGTAHGGQLSIGYKF